jgi:hypothetical protein
MPGGAIQGLRGLWREVKGLESLGVSHSRGRPTRARWDAGTLESWEAGELGRWPSAGQSGFQCSRFPNSQTPHPQPASTASTPGAAGTLEF